MRNVIKNAPGHRKDSRVTPDRNDERQKHATKVPAIIRQHSSTENEVTRKKLKQRDELSSSSSSSGEEEGSGEEHIDDIFENQEEWEETEGQGEIKDDKPAGSNEDMDEDEQL